MVLYLYPPGDTSGGVAKNIGVAKALEQNLKVKVRVPPEPQIIAALGAAICAQEMTD